MSSLELSKILTCEFHYDYIKNKHDNKSNLIFTDTDSLMYEIKTEDVYNDFSSDKEMFDFSNYSTKSKYYDDSNKLVIGRLVISTWYSLAAIKKCLILVIIQLTQNIMMIKKKLVIGKTKDKSGGAAIKEFVRLKQRCIRFW